LFKIRKRQGNNTTILASKEKQIKTTIGPPTKINNPKLAKNKREDWGHTT
jgi:hypothetical protein